MTLQPAQYQRYARHLTLPEFGQAAQEKLLASSVLLIGAGGLGSPLAIYLAAAGVGRIGIMDFDVVDLSNLQRQIIHRQQDVGINKAQSAKRAIADLNPDVEVICYETGINSDNALDIVKDYDVVIDGTDNFPTRYLVNDACVKLGKVNIYGSIYRFEGQATVFDPATGPCYRCLYPEPPEPGMVPSCAEGGVLGVLPGTIAMIQATEAIKSLCGLGESLGGRLIRYDALRMEFRTLKLRKDPACPVCSKKREDIQLIDYQQFCGLSRGQEHAPSFSRLAVDDYATWRDEGREHLLLDVREPFELAIARFDDSTDIPLGQLAQRWQEVDGWQDKDVVISCKSGQRSQRAIATLQKHGFSKLHNLEGGILAWASEIDPSLPIY
jgi:adenylyltransferase/sulfurtransferase